VPLVAITRLRVRSWRFLPFFFVAATRAGRQAAGAPGNLGAAVLNDARRTFWTMTSWHDEAAMRAFMLADPHRAAMRKLLEWCDEASVVHWSQDGPELPTWIEAHRRMLAEGRRSKVNHPSPAHLAFTIPAPVRPDAPLRLRRSPAEDR
jgi:heme-degrading monooxygenase HmoA